jgi:hypothetical protein
MAGLDSAIHCFGAMNEQKLVARIGPLLVARSRRCPDSFSGAVWMAGSSPAMTGAQPPDGNPPMFPRSEPATQSAVIAARGVASGRARGNGHDSRPEPRKRSP